MKHYKAPWGPWLIGLSLLMTALCLGIGLFSWLKGSSWLGFALVTLTAGCALFTIRGYTITPDALLVHRLLWATRVPLTGLQSAEHVPGGPSLVGIRIGNGGFFSFSGWSYVPGGGFYRVFLTDFNRKVLLRFHDRKVLVSPSKPQEFIRDLPLRGHRS